MLYEDLGQKDVLEQLVTRFYNRVYTDDVLRPLFPPDRQRVERAQVRFLIQLTGGPKQYDVYDERMNLAMIHRLLPIKEIHAIRWIELMTLTIEDTIENAEAATRLIERLRIGAFNVLRICDAHQNG
ncbi:protoglobin domain-containing protein [Exiguobacterium sp. 17-1]|uniref:truncated hemoglobin n=1 Tax=Exiguobacterium TaxID=33986 RepID=UPI001FFF77EF|nr:protoglobin domain-containing protein [Exiguobacterium sp. 17-1]MCK2158104.1 protoglobin domain-containing protein [Exiguobacterium sp. 17-1]